MGSQLANGFQQRKKEGTNLPPKLTKLDLEIAKTSKYEIGIDPALPSPERTRHVSEVDALIGLLHDIDPERERQFKAIHLKVDVVNFNQPDIKEHLKKYDYPVNAFFDSQEGQKEFRAVATFSDEFLNNPVAFLFKLDHEFEHIARKRRGIFKHKDQPQEEIENITASHQKLIKNKNYLISGLVSIYKNRIEPSRLSELRPTFEKDFDSFVKSEVNHSLTMWREKKAKGTK